MNHYLTGGIDIGLIQSLNRKGEVKDMVAGYGQIIVDECHHIPAFTFVGSIPTSGTIPPSPLFSCSATSCF